MISSNVTEISEYAFGGEETEIGILFCGSEEQWNSAVDGEQVPYGSIIFNYVPEGEAAQAQEGEAAPAQEGEAAPADAGSAVVEEVVTEESGEEAQNETWNIFTRRMEGPAITKLTAGVDKVTLRWEELKYAEGYVLEYASNKNFNGKKTVKLTGKGSVARTITNLNGGKRYFFRVQAYNSHEGFIFTTGWGGIKSVTVKTTKVSAAASAIKLSAKSVKVSVGKTENVKATVKSSGKDAAVDWASSNKKIATVDHKGNIKAVSVGKARVTVTSRKDKKVVGTITVTVVPAATESVTAANYIAGVKVSWKKVAGATGYYLYRNGKKIYTVKKGTQVSFLDKGAVTSGKKYTYKVVAYSAGGASKLSKSAVIYRLGKTVMTSVTSPYKRKLTLKWKKENSASGYVIQFGKDKQFIEGYKTVTLTDVSMVTKTFRKLDRGFMYYARIRAYKEVGGRKYFAPWSDIKYAKVKAAEYDYSIEQLGKIYKECISPIAIRTNNPDIENVSLIVIDENGRNAKNKMFTRNTPYFCSQLSYADINVTANRGHCVLEDGYVDIVMFLDPGTYSYYIYEKNEEDEDNYDLEKNRNRMVFSGKIVVEDDGELFRNWMLDIIAKSTTDDMTNHQKMNAICTYLRRNSKYIKNFVNANGDEVYLPLITDVGKTDYQLMEFTSYTSPSMLCAFGDLLGYPLESMYYDYEMDSDMWYYYHMCAINRESGNMYKFCPSTGSNTYENISSFDDVPNYRTIDELKAAY